jgi:flavin reductase (DIM6/NTAB) family NADH-FMN oxidoreductase RutF
VTLVDSATFRSVLGRFASGVTVVTVCDDEGTDHGMTVSAFCSLSLIPPLVLLCVDHEASLHEILQRATHFGINILAAEQEAISRRFAGTDPDRFEGLGFQRGQRGVALLDGALAHLECSVHSRYEGGDHTIVIGEVESAAPSKGRPLLYYRGGYAQLER